MLALFGLLATLCFDCYKSLAASKAPHCLLLTSPFILAADSRNTLASHQLNVDGNVKLSPFPLTLFPSISIAESKCTSWMASVLPVGMDSVQPNQWTLYQSDYVSC
jgi:hypothetical protein